MAYCNTLTLIVTVISLTSALQRKESCSNVERFYSAVGYSMLDVPQKAKNERDLQICPSGISCCTRTMETNLNQHAEKVFDLNLVEKTQSMRTSFITATAEFNNFFLNLLNETQIEMHSMFSRVYGPQYQSNRDIFVKLFSDYQRFYKGGNVGITDAMGQFFKNVFKRMFTLQSPEYYYSAEYLKCLEDKMEGLQPFGSLPATLTQNIRQAFVAARTFVQGLAVGRNVALEMAKVPPPASCRHAYTKLSFCSVCQGLIAIKPCNEYCNNVMKGCLAYHAQLHSSWTKYIDAMKNLVERLEGGGSFNIAVMIQPLKDQISTAIMEYHISATTVRDKVIDPKVCGVPPPASGRNKRGAKSRQRQRAQKQPKRGKQGVLATLLNDIKAKMAEVRDIWKDLPTLLCEGSESATPGSSNCWNGEEQERYTKPLVADGLPANLLNPEVPFYKEYPTSNSIVDSQIIELDKATEHLNNAKEGINVDWLDFDVLELPSGVSKSLTLAPPKIKNVETKPTTRTTTTTRYTNAVSTTTESVPIRHGKNHLDNNRGGDFEFPLHGSGYSEDTDVSSGGGGVSNDDDEDNIVIDTSPGSGWNSNIVRITPIRGRKNNKQNGGDTNKNKYDGDDRINTEGSGIAYDPSRKPIAIPIFPSKSNSGDKYLDNTMEGSGQTGIRIFAYDDEDQPIASQLDKNKPNDRTNIIQAGDKHSMTTPKSLAGTNSCAIFLLTISIILTINYITNNAVS